MWRYYAAATAIVALLGSIAFARHWAAREAEPPPRPAPSFAGDGPWAMSVLPECFDQVRSTVGPSDMLRGALPPARDRLPAGTELRWNACTLRVGAHDVRIARGSDRLRVPPEARLYARGGQLVLVWQARYGRTEIRVYARSRPQ